MTRVAFPAAPAPAVRTERTERTHLRLLVNPRVSRLRDGVAEEVAARLGTAFAVSVVHTEAAGHATDLAREAAEAGVDVVAALGGDGTVSEAASGLVGSPTALACLPAGVTNVFARSIGMPRGPHAAARRLAEREAAGVLLARAVDVGTVNGHHFLYTAGVGFTAAMAETAERAPDRKARLGQLHFAASGIAEIGRRYLRHPPEMLVEADGIEERAVTVVVQNCEALTYFGPRQMRVCERAGLATGSISLTLLRRTRLGDVAGVVSRLLSGRPGAVERHPQVSSRPALASATVRSLDGAGLPVDADGEFLGTFTEIAFGVEPGALRVVS